MNNIYETIERQIKVSPKRIAVKFKDEIITYNDLYCRIQKCYKKLIVSGVEENTIVALQANNSIDTISMILAILKIKAICLPIDIMTPEDRVKTILNHSQCTHYIDEKGIKTILKNPSKLTNKNLSIAFCIYTSGSTGYPKGIVLTHKGILNHLNSKIKLLSLDRYSTICQSMSIGFVATLWQILVPLMIGGCLIIYDNDTIKSIYKLLSNAAKDGVSVLSLTPSTLNSYLQLVDGKNRKIEFEQLKNIVLTGEILSPSLVNKYYKLYQIPLINAYGQSECSDDTFHYIIPLNTDTKVVLLGKPIPNMYALVLDEDGNEVNINECGELFIYGIGVAHGYINNDELTKKHFLNVNNKIMFKTGDFVKRLANDNIELIGRIDNQIKIRGYTVCPEEIENTLKEFEGIVESLVIEYKGELLAFYTSECFIDELDLNSYVLKKLPQYMIPNFLKIDKFEHLINGKIDRNINYFQAYRNSNINITSDNISEIVLNKINDITNIICNFETKFDSLNFNSISYLELIVTLESIFNFEFDDEKLLLTAFPTVKSIVEYIELKILTKN